MNEERSMSVRDQTRGNFSFDPSGTGSKIRESSSSLVVSIFRVRGP